MSPLAFRMQLLCRALARQPTADMFGVICDPITRSRPDYERCARECAARLFAGETNWSPEAEAA